MTRHQRGNIVIEHGTNRLEIERADIPAFLHAFGLVCENDELDHMLERMSPPHVKIETD